MLCSIFESGIKRIQFVVLNLCLWQNAKAHFKQQVRKGMSDQYEKNIQNAFACVMPGGKYVSESLRLSNEETDEQKGYKN